MTDSDPLEEIMELVIGTDGNQLQPDQAAAFREFHEGAGRIVVDAGAGTGKTTTLIRIVSEAVVREIHDTGSPFDRILLTTFSTDAANELKTRLKAQLREHDEHADEPLPQSVWREIETAADIGTIDGFFHQLLDEITIDVGLPPDFDVAGQLETDAIVEAVIEDLERTHSPELRRLRRAYPPEEWRAYPPQQFESILFDMQQKCREFCWSTDEAVQSLRESFDEMHAGQGRPTSLDDINRILEALVRPGASVVPPNEAAEQQFVAHVRETYDRTEAILDDLAVVLETFDRLYDERTRTDGFLSHTDVTYLLWEELTTNPTSALTESLASRYDYVFIDEFQDTSHAQCEVLSRLISDGSDESDGTQFMLIGDVKQSIYEWRSAEPGIFNDIIEYARETDGEATDPAPHINAAPIAYRPLVSNFRSHPQIISAANDVFERIFDEPGRGAIGDVDIDYVPLQARRPNTQRESPHLHVMDMGGETTRQPWVRNEAAQAADTVLSLLSDDPPLSVDRAPLAPGDSLEAPDPGDIAFLFRGRGRMQAYAEALRARGIQVAVDASDGLFEQPEIRLVIDILDWFANPHSRPSLLRILRSPLVALSDPTLRALASESFYLQALLDDWPDTLPEGDRDRLQGLVQLRDDLRWGRENAKSDLVYKILRHSGFDAVVLADTNALQRYGNLWLLGEIVDQWEEEELLPYREFVEQLKRLRDYTGQDQPDYTVASLADEQNLETVTLTTVHAAKGREFPIVFLVDLLARSNWPRTQLDRFLASRTNGMALRPRVGETPFPDALDIPSPDDDDVWLSEDYDADYATCTGPIWLSDERDDETGAFQYNNPLNRHLREREAEFWRTLYVAFTRARDHLFMGLGSGSIYKGTWTTWMVPLRNRFLSATENTETDHLTRLETPQRYSPSETEAPDAIPIGVDDISFDDLEPEPRPELDVSDVSDFLENVGPEQPIGLVEFQPKSITATGVHDLIECPRRYQYRLVQGISQIRYESEETTTPNGLAPTDWGDIVHRSLATWHTDEDSFERQLEDLDDSVSDVIESVVLDNYRRTSTYTSIDHHADEIVTEHPVAAMVTIDGDEIPFDGKIDLLYRDGNDWMVVDFKTGEVPSNGSYYHHQYRRQLTAYAWLVQEAYDITIRDAKVVYVYPDGYEDTFCPDIERFESELTDSIENIDIENESGLEARPDPLPQGLDADIPPTSRCGSCPYSASRGGPCEFG